MAEKSERKDEKKDERKDAYQDSVNKKVLLEWVRIVGLENPRKKPFDRVLQDFAINILKYSPEKPLAFSWPVAAGVQNKIQAIRAKVSYEFWRYYISEGRTILMNYNKENNKDIRINREQTLKVSETERLGLYIRKFIREVHLQSRRKCPDITFKKGVLQVGEYSLSPTMAAIKFNINMAAWSGLPVEDLLTSSEKEQLEKGELVRGSLRLTGVNLTKPIWDPQEGPSHVEEGEGRKRPSEAPEEPEEVVKKPKVI